MTAVTEVEFFFDPSCPWTWVTSRWLATVARQRPLDVTWRTWSLGVRNEGKELPANLPTERRARIQAGQAFATPALRVLQAAGDEAQALSGPIMAEVPPGERALALWDAVATIVREPAVFELKRHRSGHPQPPVLDAVGGRA